MLAVSTNGFLSSPHSLKSLKNVFTIDYSPILINTICCISFDMDLENYYTEQALSQAFNDIIKNRDITCSIFLDLTKASNTVNQQISLFIKQNKEIGNWWQTS